MDNKNTTKTFDLPAYLHTPQFLYQDNRLEKPATSIAAFFCSIHNAGKEITASTDYLCALANIKKRQLYNILNQLEALKYISRSGSTNCRVVEWIYNASGKITITEDESTSALQCTSDPNSALQCTQLVHSSALNYCTGVHTYNKEDIKEYKNTKNIPPNPPKECFYLEPELSPLPEKPDPVNTHAYKTKKDINTYNAHEPIMLKCLHTHQAEKEKVKDADYEYPDTYFPMPSSQQLTPQQAKNHPSLIEAHRKGFDEFWSLYPMKKNKRRVEAIWYSQGCHLRSGEIISKLKEQVAKDKHFLEGYAPNPDNYLTQSRWEDEIFEGKKTYYDNRDKTWAIKPKPEDDVFNYFQ